MPSSSVNSTPGTIPARRHSVSESTINSHVAFTHPVFSAAAAWHEESIRDVGVATTPCPRPSAPVPWPLLPVLHACRLLPARQLAHQVRFSSVLADLLAQLVNILLVELVRLLVLDALRAPPARVEKVAGEHGPPARPPPSPVDAVTNARPPVWNATAEPKPREAAACSAHTLRCVVHMRRARRMGWPQLARDAHTGSVSLLDEARVAGTRQCESRLHDHHPTIAFKLTVSRRMALAVVDPMP
eukprot:361140-Chlamydomonas_euryale.AAC.3